MKTVRSILPILAFALFATGCAQQSAVTVGSDQRGDTNATARAVVNTSASADAPDFDEYKTYSWASQITDPQNSVYFLNDLLFKVMVRDAVEHEMVSRGYTYQPTGGDLVVNFRTFDEPVEITSNSNLGNTYWATTEPYAYNAQNKVTLDKGSILVQMVDREKGVQVWQGYASGLTDGNLFNKNKDKVYVAVGQIFNEYNHRAPSL
ncbi:hypothetical protein GCM10011375_30320 [Hymenobacter qilianensis]|uniref:Uncharacterized protein n=2 Tax=Hymenobacter qilianensis TaxID=1385715 RepID=A0ACB5PUF4_9BACT|nr:DUF4136 domain-containing protein [Hymenobacter qilianensis]QNP51657.1 DUF4136 domain-containing protein [Hymenobacter qilianensis]GGF73121.1 hypothetical protein GCM10011375_30320 [Hymenobacter qilianensis]